MKERPLLFSAPMVTALLNGSKTQTRRAVKKPEKYEGGMQNCAHCCPHGAPGDRLWVKETHGIVGVDGDQVRVAYAEERGLVVTLRPGPDACEWARPKIDGDRWRPSIFMPRWASRITLEIIDVRVEQLNDISRGDAMAEGCSFANMAQGPDPRQWYAELWDSINGADSWAANPWVWVVEFRRLS